LHDTFHSQQTIPLIPDKNSRAKTSEKNTQIQGRQTSHPKLSILKISAKGEDFAGLAGFRG